MKIIKDIENVFKILDDKNRFHYIEGKNENMVLRFI